MVTSERTARSTDDVAPGRSTAGQQPPHRKRRWFGLFFVCLAVVVIVMDGSIVNVALPTLAVKLNGATNSRLQWIVDAYILSFAALLLTAGSAADRFGRKRVLLIGLAVFAGVSVGASFAGTTDSLVFWRTLMGVGAAMIFPSTLAMITDDFTEPAVRRTAIAIWAGSSGLGVALGPLAGGWLLTHLHWGAIFLVNLPVVALALVGIWLATRESKDAEHARFDPVGAVLAITGILALTWGLIEAPERGWFGPITASSLVGGVVLLASFVVWERRVATPMLDMRYFRDRRFSGGCIAIAAAFFGLFGFVFMVTQYFQLMRGYSALEAGVRTTPFAGFILFGALAAARLASQVTARALISVGLGLMAVGFAWSTTAAIGTPYGTIVLQMGVLGIGLGLVNAAATEAVMGALPANKVGTGSSVNDTLREVGGTLGIAGMGTAFNALYRARCSVSLSDAPLPGAAKALVRSSVGAATEVIHRVEQAAGAEAAQTLRFAVQQAFIDGFKASCWIACAATAVGAVSVVLLMPRGLQSLQQNSPHR